VTPRGALCSQRWGYVAAGWAVAFAALHFFWALGGSTGLATSAGERLAAERPGWFVAGGLWGVGMALLVGAGLGVATARAPEGGWRRRALPILTTALGLLLLVRGIGIEVLLLSGALDGNPDVGAGERHWSLLLWNPWFVLGGATYLLAAAGPACRAATPGLTAGRPSAPGRG
jgi:hypothetical protein